MPTERSNLSRYVIPDNLDPDGVCCIQVPVPDDRQWRAAFMGALWRLSLQTHWERDETHSAKVVAAKWREIYEEVRDMGCCDTPQSTLNIELHAYMVQNLQMAFTWQQVWLTGTQTVSIDYYQIPDTYSTDAGDLGDEIEQRRQALCLAAQGWLNEVMNYMESWMIANGEELLAGALGGPAVAGAISGLLFWPVLAGVVIATSSYLTVFLQLRSAEYRNYLICRMFENLEGKNPDLRSDFEESLDADPIGRPQPETVFEDVARDIIEAYIRSQLNNLDNYLMFAGQLGTAMDIARSGAVQCACTGEWLHTFLGGFDEGGAWTLQEHNPGYPLTIYDAVEDRFEGTCLLPAAGEGTRVTINFPSTVITQIAVSHSWHSTRATSANKTEIGDSTDADKYASCPHGTGTGSHLCDTGVISIAMTEIMLRSFAGSNTCGDASFSFITKIVITGEGIDPFL